MKPMKKSKKKSAGKAVSYDETGMKMQASKIPMSMLMKRGIKSK